MTHILIEILLAFSLKSIRCCDYKLLPENGDDNIFLQQFPVYFKQKEIFIF